MSFAPGEDPHSGKFLVWYLTDKMFRRSFAIRCKNLDWKDADWKGAFSYARRTRVVLFKFCQEALRTNKDSLDNELIALFESVVRQGKENLESLRKTLLTIKELWDGKVSYYIIKTRDDRPTGDADVLFSEKTDYESAIDIAKRNSFRFNREEPFKGWIPVDGGVKIELHRGISWFGTRVFDNDFLLDSPRTIKLMDRSFKTLGTNAEMGVELIHWMLDVQPLGAMNFSNLIELIERKPSWDAIASQAHKHHWIEELYYHLSVISELCAYTYCYYPELPIKPRKVWINPSFPFWVSFHVKLAFLMRKVLQDNEGSKERLRMLELALRRYGWALITQ